MSDIKRWTDVIPLFRSLFVITDPGRDQDDEDVLVMLNRYVRLQTLDMLGAVANLAPSTQRARLYKGTMDILGMPDIPVGIGSGCGQTDDDGLDYQFEVGYLADQDRLEQGPKLIGQVLKESPPKGVVLLLISGLTDAANALYCNHELFKKKVRRVVVMGGVKAENHQPVLDKNGFMLPDPTAQNHKFDLDATNYLYQALQLLGISMTVVSRHAATAAKVPRSIYDEMADTGHPVGARLRDAQRKAIEELWQRTCMADDDPARLGLPARCSSDWFRNAFCGGDGAGLTGEDGIWDQVKTFNLYDPVTLIAAIPTLRSHFFRSYVIEPQGTEHHIIGLDEKRHGVINSLHLSRYLRRIMLKSLILSMQTAKVAGK